MAAAKVLSKREILARRRRVRRAGIAGCVVAAVCALGLLFAPILSGPQRPDTIDTTPPTVLAVKPPGGAFLPAGEVSLELTFSERLANTPRVSFDGPQPIAIASVTFDGLAWRGTANVPDGADGAYLLRVRDVIDVAGNAANDVAFPYAVDTTPPTSRAVVPERATDEPFGIAWEATDGGSGIALVEVWIRADEDDWGLLAVSEDANGTYRFDPGPRSARFDVSTMAVDAVGNREALPPNPDASVEFNRTADGPAPASASLLAVRGYWHRGPVTLAATTEGGTVQVELRFYASRDNTTWNGPFSFGSASANAWTFPFPQGAGHYRLFARAQDARGQWEADQPPDAAEIVLGYDDIAPVSALGPVTGYWFDAPIPLVVTATDDVSGLAAVDVWYAFRPSLRDTWSEWTLAGSDDDAPYALSFPFPKGEGHYAFMTRAKDVAGNEEPGRPAGLAVGFNSGPPVAPFLLPPNFVDPDTRRTNLTWLASPSSDVARLEIHRGFASTFLPDLRPCASSATCVAALEPDTTTAWAPLGAENATAYFRVVAVDEGGLANASEPVAATFHGFGFDSPNTAADPSALPLDVAWSERLEFEGACTDGADVFVVSLGRAETLHLLLAVPASGDFRITVFDAALEAVWEADRTGFGGWETLFVFTPIPRVLYVIVDWGFHVGTDGRNAGWYTLTATVLPP